MQLKMQRFQTLNTEQQSYPNKRGYKKQFATQLRFLSGVMTPRLSFFKSTNSVLKCNSITIFVDKAALICI